MIKKDYTYWKLWCDSVENLDEFESKIKTDSRLKENYDDLALVVRSYTYLIERQAEDIKGLELKVPSVTEDINKVLDKHCKLD